MNYQGKTAFIAGGTSGINLGIAHAFAKAGARVAVLSRSQEKVDAAVAALSVYGEKAIGFAVDVRDAVAVAAAIDSAAQQWAAPIDVLVSGAAGNFMAPAEALSPNGFKTVVDIDLLGTFHVVRGAWPHLRKPGASIINITAPQSVLPTPFQVHVCAAKAGIDQLTRTLAMEWGPHGVRVNAISPGPIADTEGMRRLAGNPKDEATWTQAVPLKRYGTANDIAEAALWLSSESAGYVNGVILPVDGGLALGGSGVLTMSMPS